MKKKLALLLAGSLMLGLTACGGGSTAETTAATEAATQAEAETTKERKQRLPRRSRRMEAWMP